MNKFDPVLAALIVVLAVIIGVTTYMIHISNPVKPVEEAEPKTVIIVVVDGASPRGVVGFTN